MLSGWHWDSGLTFKSYNARWISIFPLRHTGIMRCWGNTVHPSCYKACLGEGYSPGEPLWPCTAARFSFLKVRMWAWYRELGEMWLLVLSTYRIAWSTCVWVRWVCAQVCLRGFPSCGSVAMSKDKKVAKAKRRVSVAPSKAGYRFVSSILEGICGPSSMQRVQCAFWCLHLPLNSVLKHPYQFHRRGFEWMPHSPKSHTCLKLV